MLKLLEKIRDAFVSAAFSAYTLGAFSIPFKSFFLSEEWLGLESSDIVAGYGFLFGFFIFNILMAAILTIFLGKFD